MMVSKFRTRTYYPGEKPCGSDMMPLKIVKINGGKIAKKELYQKMNDAFDGKIGILRVSFGRIKWSCMRGMYGGMVWLRTGSDEKTFQMTSENTWEEIFI